MRLVLALTFVGVLAIPAGASAQEPVTYELDSFEPAGTGGFSYSGGLIGSVWSNWFGAAFQSLSWDSTNDAGGNATSGSLKIVASFPGSGDTQFTVIKSGISPSISARQFTALECDVKFAPGSATMTKNGTLTYGNVQFGMATTTFGQDYFGGVLIPASSTGWVHVSIPLDPAVDPKLYSISSVFIHMSGGSSLVGTSTLWVDNLRFTGSTVSGNATVDYNTTRQRIDGFGASSAWDGSWTVAQADLFFSTNNGSIGLSLLRSRIAPDGSTVEAGIMQMAQARGATVWSAPWSPPQGQKDSNSVNGGNYTSSAANYQSYANQLATYVSTMRSTKGIRLRAVSVQNEPDASTTYESCVWTAQQIHDFVPYLSAALAGKGVADTGIILAESQNWNFTLAAAAMSDPITADSIGILAAHSYGSSARAVSQFGTPCPLPLWETEHYFGSDDTITNGLALAQEIHEYLTVAEVNAYHYWWLKGSGTGSLAGNSTSAPAKRLYVMGNYSRFVRPGYYRVGVANDTTALVTAFKDPASSTFVVVAANPTAWPVTQTFDVSACPGVTSLNQWVTSGNLSLAAQPPVSVAGGSFNYVLPAFSVVTFTSAAAPSPLIVLTTSDASGSTSFNAKGNWNDTGAPVGGSDYNAAQYTLRSPASGGNLTFAGHSLTLPLLGQLLFRGTNNSTLTIGNLTLSGGMVANGNAGNSFTLSGNISVAADSIIYPGSDATRSINIAARLSGTGALTNGNAGAGTVTYSGNNTAFTGAMIVNGGCILKAGSLSNLGGNPQTFNAGQLTLANGTLQPTAGFAMNNPNSGVTLATGGGTFAVGSGLSLAIDNPVSGAGNLTKSGNGTLSLNGTTSHTGTTTVSAGTLVLNGLSGSGAVAVAGGATLGGSGMIAGNATISGTLAPSAAGFTFNGSLSFGSAGRIQWNTGGNTAGAASKAGAGAVSVAAGAKIDVVLNSPGSTVNFLHGFWRTARLFPVLTASAMSGSYALGSVTADAGGRPAATYGSFTLQNSTTGATLLWTPIPGFPVIEEPTVTLTNPSGNVVSVPAVALALRVTATITGGNTTVTWAQDSGPAAATFENPSAADTKVSFPSAGTYVLRCTASNMFGAASTVLTVNVSATIATAEQAWRWTYFGFTTNSGAGADTADPDGDGENNLIEFATAQDPNAATRVPQTLVPTGATLEFTYTRSKAAIADGLKFTVEWSDLLSAGSWSAIGVTESVLSDNGILQTVRAVVPAGTRTQRFVRLRVTRP